MVILGLGLATDRVNVSTVRHEVDSSDTSLEVQELALAMNLSLYDLL